jgi:hypothetical protein
LNIVQGLWLGIVGFLLQSLLCCACFGFGAVIRGGTALSEPIRVPEFEGFKSKASPIAPLISVYLRASAA